MKMYYDADVNTEALEGKTIAVIGYGFKEEHNLETWLTVELMLLLV